MKIDVHMHLTEPVSLLADKLISLGFNHGIICSSAVAKGENIKSLSDARLMMDRVAEAQNNPSDRPIDQINRDIMTAVNQYPDLLWGFGKVDLFKPDIAGTIRDISAIGLKGIGEIVGIHGHTELLRDVFEAAGYYELPVFIHTDYPVDAEDLTKIIDMAREYPSTQIILGHMGGDFWIEAIQGASENYNLWLDTSEVVNQAALQVAVNTVPYRTMFSSDFPWDSPESMLARIDALECSDEVKKKVLGINANVLFGR